MWFMSMSLFNVVIEVFVTLIFVLCDSPLVSVICMVSVMSMVSLGVYGWVIGLSNVNNHSVGCYTTNHISHCCFGDIARCKTVVSGRK